MPVHQFHRDRFEKLRVDAEVFERIVAQPVLFSHDLGEGVFRHDVVFHQKTSEGSVGSVRLAAEILRLILRDKAASDQDLIQRCPFYRRRHLLLLEGCKGVRGMGVRWSLPLSRYPCAPLPLAPHAVPAI